MIISEIIAGLIFAYALLDDCLEHGYVLAPTMVMKRCSTVFINQAHLDVSSLLEFNFFSV